MSEEKKNEKNPDEKPEEKKPDEKTPRFNSQEERDEWIEAQMGSLSAEMAAHPEKTKELITEALKPFSTILSSLTSLTELPKILEEKLSALTPPPSPKKEGRRKEDQENNRSREDEDDPPNREEPPKPKPKPKPEAPTAKKARYI